MFDQDEISVSLQNSSSLLSDGQSSSSLFGLASSVTLCLLSACVLLGMCLLVLLMYAGGIL